jgi:hypothetical protein
VVNAARFFEIFLRLFHLVLASLLKSHPQWPRQNEETLPLKMRVSWQRNALEFIT